MNIVTHEPWTVERFLAWEDEQEGKHEFDGAHNIAMTGGSRAHQWLVFNLMRLLVDHLDRDMFDLIQAMRLNTAGKIRYPDLLVCRRRIPDQVRILQDAVVIFEILSDETAATDRSEKCHDYARLPSIKHYVRLDPTKIIATVLHYVDGNWNEREVDGGDIVLAEVAIALPLAEIYRDMRL
jgi:Uma2 family endonuclease